MRPTEYTGGCLRYLRAKHPAVTGGNVYHVQAVPSRVIPSPPSRGQAARSPVAATSFTTVLETQRPYPDWERALTCGN
jgi:hypothetical protein